MAEVEIGIGKSGRRAYGFDDIAIVPSRRTRDPDDVDISWDLDAYHSEEAALLQGRPELGQVGEVVEERGPLLVVDGLGRRFVVGFERVEGVGHGHLGRSVDANHLPGMVARMPTGLSLTSTEPRC